MLTAQGFVWLATFACSVFAQQSAPPTVIGYGRFPCTRFDANDAPIPSELSLGCVRRRHSADFSPQTSLLVSVPTTRLGPHRFIADCRLPLSNVLLRRRRDSTFVASKVRLRPVAFFNGSDSYYSDSSR